MLLETFDPYAFALRYYFVKIHRSTVAFYRASIPLALRDVLSCIPAGVTNALTYYVDAVSLHKHNAIVIIVDPSTTRPATNSRNLHNVSVHSLDAADC